MYNIFTKNKIRDQGTLYISLLAADDKDGIFYYEAENAIASIMSFPLIAGWNSRTADSLTTALNTSFPAGTIIQFVNLGSPTIDDTLQEYTNARSNAIGDESVKFAYNAIYKRAQMMKTATKEKLIKTSETKIVETVGYITFKVPLKCKSPFSGVTQDEKNFEVECRTFVDLRTQMLDQLKVAGIESNVLKSNCCLGLLRKYFNMSETWDTAIDDNRTLNEQLFPPGSRISWDKVNQDVLHFSGFSSSGENQYVGMLVIDKYPGDETVHHFSKMIGLLGNPPGDGPQIGLPYTLTTTIHFPEQQSKEAKLRTSQLITEKQSTSLMLKWSPRLRKKSNSFEIMSQAIQEGNNIVEVTTTLCVFSKSYNAIKKTLNTLASYYRTLGFIMRKERYIPAVSFLNQLPMNACAESIKKTHRFKTMGANHAVHLLPICDEWQGFGNELLLTTRLGRLFKYSLFHENNKNYNWIVIASSGSGKSFFVQRKTQDLLSLGAKIWTIDTGNSYIAAGQVAGAQIIDFHENSDICLNPFSEVKNIKDEVELILPILSKMACTTGEFTNAQRALAEEAILSVYTAKGGKAEITDIIQYLNNQTGDLSAQCRELALLLSPFSCTGSMGRWFSGKFNLHTQANWTILELSGLTTNKHLCDVVLMCISINIAQQMFMSKDGIKKELIIEEGGDRITDPSFAKFIAQLYAKVRKEDGSVGVVIQNLNQLFTTDYGKIILASAGTQFILQQTTEAIADAVNNQHLVVDNYTEGLIRSVHTVKNQYSEICIRSETGTAIGRLIETPFNKVLFNTEGEFFKHIQAQVKAGVNVADIIQQQADRIYATGQQE